MKNITLLLLALLGVNLLNAQDAQETPKQRAYREGNVRKIIPDTIINPNIYLDRAEGSITNNSRFKNSVKVTSIEIKNGLFYVNFTADVQNTFSDNKILRDGQILDIDTTATSPQGTHRTFSRSTYTVRGKKWFLGKTQNIEYHNSHNFVYVTPATNGKVQTIKTSGWSLGLMNVPFKIRGRMDTIRSETKADVKNILLQIGKGTTWERYFSNGTTSKHKLSYGLLIGPSVETLTPANTRKQIIKENTSNQVYLSTAIGISYSYNEKLSFALIPIGADTGFSNTSKKWIYNGRYWFGFGIGIDISGLKIF